MSIHQPHRAWMYDRVTPTPGHPPAFKGSFIIGVEEFIHVASNNEQFFADGTIRCPCEKCVRKLRMLTADEVRIHLYDRGFKPGYWYWTEHGEVRPDELNELDEPNEFETNNKKNGEPYSENLRRYKEVVHDPVNINHTQTIDKEYVKTHKFFELLRECNEPLWNGCELQSPLSVAVRILSIKIDHNLHQDVVDKMLKLMSEMLSKGHNSPQSFYEAEKLVSRLVLESWRMIEGLAQEDQLDPAESEAVKNKKARICGNAYEYGQDVAGYGTNPRTTLLRWSTSSQQSNHDGHVDEDDDEDYSEDDYM